MTGVDASGNVDPKAIGVLKNWTKNNTIQDGLLAIRKEMETSTFKKTQQPAEGTLFS